MSSRQIDAGPSGPASTAVVAALEHLTGVARGATDWVIDDVTDVRLDKDGRLALETFAHDDPDHWGDDVMARLLHRDGGYQLEASADESVWVNGALAGAGRSMLRHGDVVEFGDNGPIVKFSFFRQGGRPHHTTADILADVVDYLRVSRRPLPTRVWRALLSTARRLSFETSLLFRVGVLTALAVLVALFNRQADLAHKLEAQIASGAARLDSFSAALARSRDEALRPADLNAVRRELAAGMSANAERLAALEEWSQASANAIAAARPSVVFIQGAYGFRQRNGGALLRHQVDADGRKLFLPNGQPLLQQGGPGPVAERQYTGTGFALADSPLIATNRHVALPWEQDASAEALAAQGLEPFMVRMIAYFADAPAPIGLSLERASDAADLALLSREDAVERATGGLSLAGEVPAPGAEVIVLGYPTGLRSMLARTGEAFVESLQAEQATGFWEVAERLAEAGYVAPLASRGIVGQATPAAIVYDAETTHGGSGGPVLNAAGEVVAVNTAILPEYGGSNLGAPVELLRQLLEASH